MASKPVIPKFVNPQTNPVHLPRPNGPGYIEVRPWGEPHRADGVYIVEGEVFAQYVEMRQLTPFREPEATAPVAPAQSAPPTPPAGSTEGSQPPTPGGSDDGDGGSDGAGDPAGDSAPNGGSGDAVPPGGEPVGGKQDPPPTTEPVKPVKPVKPGKPQR